jgi:hypothetical protein
VEIDLQNLSIIEQHDLFTKSFTRDKRPASSNAPTELFAAAERKMRNA